MPKTKSLYLKLKKLSSTDGRETKLQITLDPSTSNKLDQYLDAYEKAYSEKAKPEAIVAAIIRQYLESDRAFRSYKRTLPATPPISETPIE
jgi:hypothetical protein